MGLRSTIVLADLNLPHSTEFDEVFVGGGRVLFIYEDGVVGPESRFNARERLSEVFFSMGF